MTAYKATQKCAFDRKGAHSKHFDLKFTIKTIFGKKTTFRRTSKGFKCQRYAPEYPLQANAVLSVLSGSGSKFIRQICISSDYFA